MRLLMLGSGPGAVEARDWSREPFDTVVAINNAWRIRDDWDYLVYPYDFPPENMPPEGTGTFIDETHFVPAQNAYGGFVFGGATMAFTATYWTLHALKPALIAYLGCDMHYPKTGPTHFYGAGTADPLRDDVSLRNLEARSERARIFAARQNCALVNLSEGPSRLTFPRATQSNLPDSPAAFDAALADRALAEEARLDYRTPTGFHDHLKIDTEALDAIDTLWLAKS